MKVVVHTLDDVLDSPVFSLVEKGSISTYKNECGRYIRLQIQDALMEAQAKEAMADEDEEPPEPEETPDYQDTSQRTIGKIFHKLVEYYHDPKKAGMELVWQLPSMFDEALRIAMWLFDAYTAVVPPGTWGNPMTEVLFPRTVKEKTAMAKHVGTTEFPPGPRWPGVQARGGVWVPFKMILDQLTYLSETHVRWINKQPWCTEPLPGPGWYILDFKTSSRHNDGKEYVDSHQRIAYTSCTEMLRKKGMLPELGDEPIRGMLFFLVSGDRRSVGKRDKVKMSLSCAPRAGHGELRMVQNDFRNRAVRIGESQANGFACHAWGRLCRYAKEGRCTRV